MSLIIGDTMTKKEVKGLINYALVESLLIGAWCYGEKPAKSLRKEMIYLTEELFSRFNDHCDRPRIEEMLDKIGW